MLDHSPVCVHPPDEYGIELVLGLEPQVVGMLPDEKIDVLVEFVGKGGVEVLVKTGGRLGVKVGWRSVTVDVTVAGTPFMIVTSMLTMTTLMTVVDS